MPIFFVKNDDIDKSTAPLGDVHIYGDDAYHIARSLRMAVGDGITVSDGECKYDCTLRSVRDAECVASIERVIGRTGEPPYFVEVFQALPKGDKLDVVIQKSVECGACSIVPFASEFCTVKAKDASSEQKKLLRRSRIAYEAAKQCQRTVVPKVHATVTFDELLHEIKRSEVVLFCYENEKEHTLGEVLRSLRERDGVAMGLRIAVIIGSEGGFSEREAEALTREGAIPVSLGQRILRCESAGMFVLSALSCMLET